MNIKIDRKVRNMEFADIIHSVKELAGLNKEWTDMTKDERKKETRRQVTKELKRLLSVYQLDHADLDIEYKPAGAYTQKVKFTIFPGTGLKYRGTIEKLTMNYKGELVKDDLKERLRSVVIEARDMTEKFGTMTNAELRKKGVSGDYEIFRAGAMRSSGYYKNIARQMRDYSFQEA